MKVMVDGGEVEVKWYSRIALGRLVKGLLEAVVLMFIVGVLAIFIAGQVKAQSKPPLTYTQDSIGLGGIRVDILIDHKRHVICYNQKFYGMACVADPAFMKGAK